MANTAPKTATAKTETPYVTEDVSTTENASTTPGASLSDLERVEAFLQYKHGYEYENFTGE